MVSSGESWLFKGLQTDPVLGIDSKSIPQRLAAYGSNEVEKQPLSSFLELMVEALKDLTLVILVCAAVVSMVVSLVVEKEHRVTGSRG